MDIKQKIIEKFNKDLGSNLKNLEEIYDFQKHLKAEKDEIEKSVGIYLQSNIICSRMLYTNYFSLTVVNGINHCSFKSKSSS